MFPIVDLGVERCWTDAGDNSLEIKRNPVVRLLLFNMRYDDALSFTSTVISINN